jgi:hypothetical protein
MEGTRAMLRHTIATLAYRGGKALRGAPATFADFRVAAGTRTPIEILAHVGDLLDWALSLARGAEAWHASNPGNWDGEVARFFDGLARLDAYLVSDATLAASAERVFQGPVADALTHVGQIAMLRRIAGSPVKGENYARAAIAAGGIGMDQAPPRVEFD